MRAVSPLAPATPEQNAKSLFEAGRYAEATVEFDKAYRATGDPALLYNMAVCHRLSGDSARAINLYEEYLIRAPSSPNRTAVENKIRQLRQEQANAPAGSVTEARPAQPAMPAATAPQVAPAAPAPIQAVPLVPQAANAAPGQTGLTEAQLSDLKSAGSSVDVKDLEIADRLLRRGFSGDELVAAYREHNALKNTYPEFGRFGREMVETLAVARKMNLGESDKYWLVWYRHDQNLSLTEAYNRKVVECLEEFAAEHR